MTMDASTGVHSRDRRRAIDDGMCARKFLSDASRHRVVVDASDAGMTRAR